MGANTIWADLSPRPSCDLLWTRSHETRRSMTLIMRAEEERGESNRAAQDLLPPQVRHLFCFRERSLSPPQRRGRGGDGGWDEVTGGQDPFSVSPLWQWFVSARLNYVCVRVCVREEYLLPHGTTIPHTHTHTYPLSCSVLWPCADLSQYLVHLSTGDLLIPLSSHHSLSKHVQCPPPPPGGWEISNHQLMLTPVCTQC